MEYKNHKITEAVCAFRFDPRSNDWDFTSSADYYSQIKTLGFIKKNEIKPIQLSFQFRANEAPNNAQMVEGETQIVFKNEDESRAILLGNNYISFHTLNHYPGWDSFLTDFISICLNRYFEIGYGKNIISVQMIFINNFELKNSAKLSEYLTFVPEMDKFGEGNELSHLFQSAYDIAPNKRLQLKTILNVVGESRLKKTLLECNCIASNSANFTWEELSRDAHDSAKNAFINITTDHFKTIIK